MSVYLCQTKRGRVFSELALLVCVYILLHKKSSSSKFKFKFCIYHGLNNYKAVIGNGTLSASLQCACNSIKKQETIIYKLLNHFNLNATHIAWCYNSCSNVKRLLCNLEFYIVAPDQFLSWNPSLETMPIGRMSFIYTFQGCTVDAAPLVSSSSMAYLDRSSKWLLTTVDLVEKDGCFSQSLTIPFVGNLASMV